MSTGTTKWRPKFEWYFAWGLLALSVLAAITGKFTASAILLVGFAAIFVYLRAETSRIRAADEAYVNSVIGDEPFEVIFQLGVSGAAKIGISHTNKAVLSPQQVNDNRPLITEFLQAATADDRVTMTRIFTTLYRL